MDKSTVLSRDFLRNKNYSYNDREEGYTAVDEYYLGLLDVGFITEAEYSAVRVVNENYYLERRYENNDE